MMVDQGIVMSLKRKGVWRNTESSPMRVLFIIGYKYRTCTTPLLQPFIPELGAADVTTSYQYTQAPAC